MNKIALSCALFLAAGFAFGREPVQLSNWRELPFELENHTVTLVTHDGKEVKGKLLQRGLTDFAMDVSATADEARYARGRHAISHYAIAEVHASIRRAPFREFANAAFIQPLSMAVHDYGLCAFLWELGGGGTATGRVVCHLVDLLAEPLWLGWAAGGLAVTPLVAPIRFLQGSVDYDFQVR